MGMRTETTPAAGAVVGAHGLADRKVPLFVRIRTDLAVVLVDLNYGNAIHGRVENLSVGGMFVGGADTLEVGGRVVCALAQTDGEYQEEFHTSGTVVHRHGHGVGIAFGEVTPFAFTVISELIAAEGCFRVDAIEAPCMAAPERRA